ncbi:hypothetical protein PISMIDRAFT_121022 [Pisolithus microcarpus 441]|uniref:Uncharacterized protein n=1 Tax=Pisolithus microcarpus 441 TaxID=765257 RepID=A0A0C9XJ76_9AGAM|nr:hypothetical protein PISMIDRAFT_121022 [Pisolithus microcarpus 441]
MPCSTPICIGHKQIDHDWNNCCQPGGGKVGQAPWQKAKSANTISQVAATVTPAPTVTTPQSGGPQVTAPLAAVAIQCPSADSYFRDLSCATYGRVTSGERVMSLAEATFSTILDSGTTTHLIRDLSLFWTFTQDSTVSMQTANQGRLNMEGYGECVAVLKLGDKHIHLQLEHCLHTSANQPISCPSCPDLDRLGQGPRSPRSPNKVPNCPKWSRLSQAL